MIYKSSVFPPPTKYGYSHSRDFSSNFFYWSASAFHLPGNSYRFVLHPMCCELLSRRIQRKILPFFLSSFPEKVPRFFRINFVENNRPFLSHIRIGIIEKANALQIDQKWNASIKIVFFPPAKWSFCYFFVTFFFASTQCTFTYFRGTPVYVGLPTPTLTPLGTAKGLISKKKRHERFLCGTALQ